ncbi:MAG: GAF domain-containing sensor histidine kinase [Armatimonadetes bacterium]|nr:GAF domain-containing sensor histidine kinase [Armatimonadota bacterium]
MRQRAGQSRGRPQLTPLQQERILRQGIESALEEIELRPLLSKILQSACHLLGADDGGVGLVAQNPRRIVMEAVHNLPESEIGSAWLPGEGIAGRVLQGGKTFVCNRYGEIDPQERPELAENAVLGVPILRRKKMVGFFGIGANPPRQFSEVDARILTQYARACAAAIENARLFDETSANLDQTHLLYETTTALSRARGLEDVVQAYLSHIAKGRRYRSHVVTYEFGPDGEPVKNVSLCSWSPEGGIALHAGSIPHTRDNLDPILDEGRVVLFDNIQKDKTAPKGLRLIQEKEGSPALALIPLLSRGRRIGLVTLSLPYPHGWTNDEIQPFLVSSAHLAAAIDTRMEQERLADERAALALVEDRKRLARDLHDSVTQTLFAIQLFSQSLLDEVPGELSDKVQNMADLSKTGLREMRALLAELRPVESASSATTKPREAMADLLGKHAREIGLVPVLAIQDERQATARPEVEHTLYRIAQEALSNVHKHARANHVTVRLAQAEGSINLEVSDDGRGLPVSELPKSGMTLGIIGMRERALALGGTLEVASDPGHGVTIRVKVPV